MQFTTGGVPSVYAGDEFGLQGVKEDRAGGDDAVRPEFGPGPADPGGAAADVLTLHQFLIGLRRRNPWLHQARTTALTVENRRYAYETRCGDDALLVALNLDATPMPLAVEQLAGCRAEVIAGTAAPPRELTGATVVAPHGWLVLKPQ